MEEIRRLEASRLILELVKEQKRVHKVVLIWNSVRSNVECLHHKTFTHRSPLISLIFMA